MKLNIVRTCKFCNTDISNRVSNANFCGINCRSKFQRRYGKLTNPEDNIKHCRMCGEVLPFNNQSGLCPGFCYDYHQELRSAYRVSVRRGVIYDRNCLHCGTRILTAFKHKVYCDDTCKRAAQSHRMLFKRGGEKTNDGFYKLVCSSCGNSFVTASRLCRRCPQCKETTKKTTQAQWVDNNREHLKEYRKAHQPIINERQRNARKTNPEYFNKMARSYHKRTRDALKQKKIIENQELLFATVQDAPLGNSKAGIALKYKGTLGIVRKSQYVWNCIRCGKDFIPTKSPSGIANILKPRVSSGQSPCPWCGSAPVGNNKLRSVEDDLFSLYPEFTERNYHPNWLNGKEIDLYDPSSKVGIEYDGIVYHSSKYKGTKTYHYEKTAIAEENGVNLIHILETDWMLHRDCVLHIIDAALGKLSTVQSVDCTYQCISDDMLVNEFLIANHIKGATEFDLAIGISYNNELIGVCCLKRISGGEWHISRYATKLNLNILGGLTNTIKYIQTVQQDVSSFTTKVECIYGNWVEQMLVSAGFIKVEKSGPNPWFTDLCATHELLENIPVNVDATKFYEIYDSGKAEYRLTVSE